MEPHNVATFVGSLRRDSLSRRVAMALAALAPSSLALDVVEIGQVPFYNQDLETDTPPDEWVVLRRRVASASAVLFVTPEYNRSVPAVLKNAIDVGSRPKTSNVWDRKPGGVVSVSPGALAGFGANHHLRQALVAVNVPTMQRPEAYIGGAAALFDQSGALVNASTRDFLSKFMAAFAEWVERNLRPA